jgi:hypothetical protein
VDPASDEGGFVSDPVVGGSNPGDFDGDGVITDADFDLFAGVFGLAEGDPNFDPKFDLDEDGQITLVDMQMLVDLADGQGD